MAAELSMADVCDLAAWLGQVEWLVAILGEARVERFARESITACFGHDITDIGALAKHMASLTPLAKLRVYVVQMAYMTDALNEHVRKLEAQ